MRRPLSPASFSSSSNNGGAYGPEVSWRIWSIVLRLYLCETQAVPDTVPCTARVASRNNTNDPVQMAMSVLASLYRNTQVNKLFADLALAAAMISAATVIAAPVKTDSRAGARYASVKNTFLTPTKKAMTSARCVARTVKFVGWSRESGLLYKTLLQHFIK